MIVPHRRLDPVFGLPSPLLFAHRGGANEQPESTERAFRSSSKDVQVLEIDVQVTRGEKPEDEQFVVWHGPGLDHVVIDGKKAGQRPRNHIGDFTWAELECKSYVACPPYDLDNLYIDDACDTRLMTLEQALSDFSEAPLNIEMKKDTFRKRHMKRFLDLLNRYRGKRPINVVSQSRTLIQLFRKECEDSYPTGLSSLEAVYTFAGGVIPGLSLCDMNNRALQSVHARFLTPARLIRKVHAQGGSVHVFLNAPDFLAIDRDDNRPNQEEITELLDRGVDGIMTDRPHHVRPLINRWLQLRHLEPLESIFDLHGR